MFNPENRFWKAVSSLVDIVGLSLLWVALCLPVITIGPATASLYYTVVKSFRQGEDSTFGLMLKTFRSNLKKGILLTVICEAVTAALGLGYYIMSQHTDQTAGIIMYALYSIALFIPAGTLVCVFPLMGRFEMSIPALLKTAFALTLAHMPVMAILVIANLACIVWGFMYLYPVFFAPTLLTLISSFMLDKVFLKHLDDEEEREKLTSRADTAEK